MLSVLRFLLLLFFIPVAAGASVLSEEEFLSVLDESHPSLIALEREMAEAEARERAASLLSNPVIRAEREAWGEVAQQSTLALSWTPPLDGRRGPRVGAARSAVEAARYRGEAARLRIRGEARAVYAEWWMAEQRYEVLTRQADRVREIVTRVRNRAASGEESSLTARRFELAALRVQAELVSAKVKRARAVGAIRSWYRAEDPGWEPLRPDLPPPPDSLGWKDRPAVQALVASAERAEQERRGAARFLAFPSLEFGWTWLEGDDAGVDGPVAGLSWDLPLFDRNQAEKTRAAGDLRAARAELELEERKARNELSAAVVAYEAIHGSAFEAWEATADLDSLIKAALASFQAGESTDTDLLEILASALEARLSTLELYSAALAAHRALEEAAGTPLTRGASR